MTELARTPEVRTALYPALQEPSATKEEKSGLAQVFGASGGKDAIAPLQALSKDSSPEVTEEALRALRSPERPPALNPPVTQPSLRPPPTAQCEKMKLMTKSLLLCLALLTFGSVLSGQTTPESVPPPVSLNEFSTSLENLVNRVRPCVVQIYSTGYATSDESDGTSASLLSKQHSTGSGITVSVDGYILTNAHVVKGARRIQVRLPSRAEVSGRSVTMQPEGKLIDAKLVGLDRDIDLAVVKIDQRRSCRSCNSATPTASIRVSW